MANQKSQRIKITFNKKELQARAHKFSFREARRHSGNFYNALVQELLEDGCPTTAKYFKLLSNKETDYYKSNIILDRVKDESTLILAIYDNCKMAERAALLKQCEGMAATFGLLYQVMCLLEQKPYDIKFNWLIKDVFKIIVQICDKLGPENNNVEKPICKIYFKYAEHLRKDTDTAELALLYYEKALNLAKASKWLTDQIDSVTHKSVYLYSEVAHKFAKELMKFGNKIVSHDYKQAVELGHKALCILSVVGYQENKLEITLGRLNIAEYFIEGEQFLKALNILQKIEQELQKVHEKTDDMVDMRLNLNKGICFVNLKQPEMAMECLRRALLLSQQLKMKSIEGVTLMNMGKLYLHKGSDQRFLAKTAFTKSMKIFNSLNDTLNRKKNQYLLAQVMSQSLSLVFMDLLKRSEKYSNFFSLRRWKYNLKPFWDGLYLTEDAMANDQVLYLLEEFTDETNARKLFKI